MSADQRTEDLSYVKTFGCSAPALGCLVKAPFGCLAFVGGFAAMLFVLFPPWMERMIHEDIADDFGRDYLGTLDVGAVRWSWFDPLVLEDAVVREPDGREVGQVTLRAPNHGSLFDYVGSAPDGRLPAMHLELSATVHVDEGGRTNVARALAPDPERPQRAGWDVRMLDGGIAIDPSSGPEGESRFEAAVSVELDVPRFDWFDARGPSVELVAATGSLDLPRSGPLTLRLEGGLAGSEEARFTFAWETADRDVLFDDAVALAPSFELVGTDWPAERVERLLGLAPDALAEVGAVVSTFTVRAAPAAGDGLALSVEIVSGEDRWRSAGRFVDLLPELGPLTRSG